MPTHDRNPEDIQPEAAIAEFAAGFHRSVQGNLSRIYNGDTVTVFKHRGCYGWCIYHPEEDYTEYSRETCESQETALIELARELLVFL